HAFQVRVDLHGTGDEAHVPGHGLVQGQQAVADLIDFDFQVVDVPVALDDPAGKLAVPVHDGLDGEADGFLHAATHQEDLFLQPGQFLVKVNLHSSPSWFISRTG